MDSEGLANSLQTPPMKRAKLGSGSSSDKSVVHTTHAQLSKEASMELDDHSVQPPSFVYLVSDDDDEWKYWNNPSEWKKGSTDRLNSTASRSSVESDAARSIAAAEPLEEIDGLPHTRRPYQVIEGSNETLSKTSGGDLPTNRLVKDAFEVALEMDDAREFPDIPLSPPESGNASETSSTLPRAIRALLDEWYAREGHRKPLPCATRSDKRGTLNCDYKGRPAIYTCNNGEVLTVELFPVPSVGYTTGEQKYVMVARGATLGWAIIGYLRSRGDGKGSHVTEYRIWKGTRCQDPNGWDESVLVEKRLKSGLPTNPGKHGRGLKPSMPSSRPSVAQNISPAGHESHRDILRIPSSSPIPSQLGMLINEWCLLQGPGHALPFATTTKNPHFSSSKSGTPAYFKHDNGAILDVALYPLDSQRPQDRGSNLIIAQGQGSGPFLIMPSSKGEGRGRTTCAYYYTWIGVSGDTNGFAFEFTIAKYFGKGPQIREKNTLPTHEPLQLGASAVEPSTGSPSKRRRLDTSTNGSLKITPSLHEHVRNHTVLLFFSANNKTPRVRLLGTCDSVQKLFAEAWASVLFTKRWDGPNLLFINLAGQQGTRRVIENDTDGFEDLLIAITRLSCWNVVGGKIDGSCTVEIRALKVDGGGRSY